MEFPGNGSSGNLARTRHKAGDVVVTSAVDVSDSGEGGVHGSSSDTGRDGEGGADLHEVSISSKDSRDEEKGTDDFGDVGCGEWG